MSRALRYPAVQVSAAERVRYQRWWLEDSGLSRGEIRLIASRIWPEDAARAAWRRDSLVRAKSAG